MDSELKAKWVETLRSGKYKQGKDRLRSVNDEFCCLGVLCDVYDSGMWVFEKEEESEVGCWVYKLGEDFSQQNAALLPYTLEDSLCMKEFSGQLVADNDAGVSFEHIANYIEKNV